MNLLAYRFLYLAPLLIIAVYGQNFLEENIARAHEFSKISAESNIQPIEKGFEVEQEIQKISSDSCTSCQAPSACGDPLSLCACPPGMTLFFDLNGGSGTGKAWCQSICFLPQGIPNCNIGNINVEGQTGCLGALKLNLPQCTLGSFILATDVCSGCGDLMVLPGGNYYCIRQGVSDSNPPHGCPSSFIATCATVRSISCSQNPSCLPIIAAKCQRTIETCGLLDDKYPSCGYPGIPIQPWSEYFPSNLTAICNSVLFIAGVKNAEKALQD